MAHQRVLAAAFLVGISSAAFSHLLTRGLLPTAGPWLTFAALAALLLATRRSRWLAVSIVSVATAALTWAMVDGAPTVASAIRAAVWASAAGFGANVAANLVRRVWGARQRFDRGLQALSFLTLAVGFANALAALAAASALRLLFGDNTTQTLLHAFVLQAVALLLLVPLATVLPAYRQQWREAGFSLAWFKPTAKNIERWLLTLGFVATLFLVFWSKDESFARAPSRTYLATPFILWAALRFGPKGVTLACLVLALVGLVATTGGLGPYAAAYAKPSAALLALAIYLAVVTAMALVASALIAEREWALAQSAAWRDRFEAAVEASGEALYEYQPYSSSMAWSGANRRVMGVGEEDISTFGAYLLRIHASDRDRVALHFEGLAAGEELSAIEYSMVRPDGSVIRVQDRGRAVRSQHRQEPMRVIGFVRDVTRERAMQQEQARMETKLFQAERLQAIGRLAGAIAHDFNNILGSVLGYGQMLAEKLSATREADSQLTRYAGAIVSAGERGRSLVDQVFAFSRQEKAAPESLNLAPVIAEVSELLQGSLPPEITVATAIDPATPKVRAHATRLHQLLMNLSSNAVRAMPSGGCLTLSAHAVRADAPLALSHGNLSAGNYAMLRVQDTGRGMDAGTLARIFEPFFTTGTGDARGNLAGIGLGLTIVHAILQEHEAVADIQSAPGSGTAFSVYFRADELAALRAQTATSTDAFDGAGRTVLVVDDEAALLAFAEDLLAELGFEPVGINDSRTALDMVRADPTRFDLVMTDEVMPGLTGTDLTRELRTLAPHLPVLIASGYGGAGFEARAIAAGVDYTIKKPYARETLEAALTQVLGARQKGRA